MKLWATALGAAVVLALAACAGEGRGDDSGRIALTVSAASSLAGALARAEREFEAEHPDVDVTVNAGASSTLAEQIVRGAPVDVFAAADRRTMGRVTGAGAARGRPRVFARNMLQIAVPPEDRGKVRDLRDLARPELVIALCAEQAPCGSAATRVLAAAGVTAQPDTFEQDAQATITKVRLGEVDAALVYRTDVLAAGKEAAGIDFPEAAEAVNDYLIVVLRSTRSVAVAQAFVDHLRGPRGQAALADAGFVTP